MIDCWSTPLSCYKPGRWHWWWQWQECCAAVVESFLWSFCYQVLCSLLMASLVGYLGAAQSHVVPCHLLLCWEKWNIQRGRGTSWFFFFSLFCLLLLLLLLFSCCTAALLCHHPYDMVFALVLINAFNTSVGNRPLLLAKHTACMPTINISTPSHSLLCKTFCYSIIYYTVVLVGMNTIATAAT
jgi:hypothetical protein